MKLQEVGRHLSHKDIDGFESRMAIKLPSDVRKFYLDSNGGRPEVRYFKIDGEDLGIAGVLSIADGDSSDIEKTYDLLVGDDDLWPKHLIPIANDYFGNLIAFSVDAESFGQVFFVDLEFFDEPDQYVTWLASSFSQFLEKLEPDPDPELE